MMDFRTEAETMNSQTRVRLSLLGVAFLVAGAAYRAIADVRSPKPEEKVPMLFVQSARGAILGTGTLTLTGVSLTTIFFSDRPKRVAGHMATSEMVPLWTEGTNSFAKDPPNATLSAFADGKMNNVVLELRNPRLAADSLTYDVKILQGSLTAEGATDGASLFIDVIGMPLTPLSYAGAARRTYRAVVY
jgi:hypothetical protein